jgi:glycine/D-amino acid oxidase-like deaminating enzyme
MTRAYRELSLWHETVPGALDPRPALTRPSKVDVAIVGAGFTGLWTAYYLLGADPSLKVAIVESEIAGFGASGRNGGWCSALFPISAGTLAKEHGHRSAVAQYAAMRAAVAEVVRVAEAEKIQADVAQGGSIVMARSGPQLERSRTEMAESEEFGLGLSLLDGPAARARVNATDVQGATFTAHCAAIHPAKLVRGLAAVVEQRGARIYERTRAERIERGAVHTARGAVRADVVIRATEGYTPRLPGQRRAIAPVYSLMIATEPLPESTWDQIGLRERETFSDERHLIIYGQRTVDGRMVFGGRGAPYHLGSRIRTSYDRVPKVFEALQQTIVGLFPVLADARITHRWGGPLGIARDWHASVGLADGLGWAGGYVGDGVATTNLAGRTLSDLVTGRTTELTSLPWVNHRSRNWEPEPLRWLGANAGLQAMTWADAAERRRGKPSRLAAVVNQVMGR